MKSKPTEIELAVLREIAGRHPEIGNLDIQVANVVVKSRRYTGVGFYSDFEIPDSVAPLIACPRANIMINGFMSGQLCHFILWPSNDANYIEQLEIVTPDDSLPEGAVLESFIA